MDNPDILVIGAGAAGLTAAIFATQKGKRVLLLERTPQAGRKILMSGGTRCNILPVRVAVSDYETASSKNRLRNIFKSWSIDQCRRWFEEEIGLELLCETKTNKWFPKSNSAREVRDKLLQHAESLGVSIRSQSMVTSIHRSDKQWYVTLENGDQLQAPSVIAATGGLSIPGCGTDGTGHVIMEQLGHKLHPPYPALTPLKGPHPGGGNSLPGVSLDVELTCPFPAKQSFQNQRGGFLFTHQGYSGPAVLDLSHLIVKSHEEDPSRINQMLRVNWIGESPDWWRSQFEGKQDTRALLRRHLPGRLADALLAENGLSGKKTAELTRSERNRLVDDLTNYQLQPTGHFGFDKAEVTGGGVPLEEVNPATMESRIAPGLYLCGELLDVFGRIGGFNFYWAWVTGRLAGISQYQ